LIAALALALAACQSTPTAPPTQTPVNPRDTFATPGAPTPFLPTMTPVPSPTVRPTAIAVPPTAVPATVAVPTLAPTKGGTATPTPVIVNGQPKMWWVDQMVKQADGSYLAPTPVVEAITAMTLDFYLRRSTLQGRDSKTVAQGILAELPEATQRFFIGELRVVPPITAVTQINVLVTGTITVTSVRGFVADGVTGYVGVETTKAKVDIYATSDWTRKDKDLPVADIQEIWLVRFDQTDSRWKFEKRVFGAAK
jgi:hypothetical protein